MLLTAPPERNFGLSNKLALRTCRLNGSEPAFLGPASAHREHGLRAASHGAGGDLEMKTRTMKAGAILPSIVAWEVWLTDSPSSVTGEHRSRMMRPSMFH